MDNDTVNYGSMDQPHHPPNGTEFTPLKKTLTNQVRTKEDIKNEVIKENDTFPAIVM